MRRRNPAPAGGVSAEEMQWLSGQQISGANPFWQHIRGEAKAERCAELVKTHRHLIPSEEHLAKLIDDIKHWQPRGRSV